MVAGSRPISRQMLSRSCICRFTTAAPSSARSTWIAKHGGVPTQSSGADTEGEPPAREIVERHRLLGEHHRMAEVRRGHKRPEANARRGRCGSGQCGQCPEPRRITKRAPRQVFIGPRMVEAELLLPRHTERASSQRCSGRITTPRRTLARYSGLRLAGPLNGAGVELGPWSPSSNRSTMSCGSSRCRFASSACRRRPGALS